MRRHWRRRAATLGLIATLAIGLLTLAASETEAQRAAAAAARRRSPRRRRTAKPRKCGASSSRAPRESVQADVSARNVAVTSSFNGTEIVIFGAVDNSQQPSAESGYYDVVIVVEGVPARLVVRRKNNVAGLWLNTSSATFDLVPSYYAIASTRPIDEIASEEFRATHGIGFQHLRFTPAFGQTQALSTEDLKEFRAGRSCASSRSRASTCRSSTASPSSARSLFRATIELPANVTVGPFETRVYLFRDEKLLSQYTARLNLEREGLERHLHAFAFGFPTLYGLMTVVIAVAAGLLASTVFRKAAH